MLHCNQIAERIVRRGDGVLLKDGHLTAAVLADQKALQTAFERAAAPSQAEASALRVRRREPGEEDGRHGSQMFMRVHHRPP